MGTNEFIEIFKKVLCDWRVIVTTVTMLIVIDISYKIVNYRRKAPKIKKKTVTVKTEKKPVQEKKEEPEEAES